MIPAPHPVAGRPSALSTQHPRMDGADDADAAVPLGAPDTGQWTVRRLA